MDFSSSGSLIVSLVVGSIGLGLFMHGKKLSRMPQLGVGASMMVYPYFITGVVPMLGVCVLMLGGLWMLEHGSQ